MFLSKQPIMMFALICFMASATPSTADDTTAIDLLHAQGCKGCHTLNGSGGIIAPPLDGVGNRLNREQILQKLTDPENSNPASLMPDSRHLSELELNLLTDYLTRRR